jgi:hypothetical protein
MSKRHERMTRMGSSGAEKIGNWRFAVGCVQRIIRTEKQTKTKASSFPMLVLSAGTLNPHFLEIKGPVIKVDFHGDQNFS